MNTKTTANLRPKDLPSDDADVREITQFAHTFDGYARWGSFERCAEIANAPDHSTIDKLRTCLFFEARRWRHFGERPDEEAITYWRKLVSTIRTRIEFLESASPDWLATAISQLPSDAPVPKGTQGYNLYTTQKDHWIGWLNPGNGTGTYPRQTGKNASAKVIYNRIGEPKMLLWLSQASGVEDELLSQARVTAGLLNPLASQCAAIRKILPWRTVADALDAVCRTPTQ